MQTSLHAVIIPTNYKQSWPISQISHRSFADSASCLVRFLVTQRVNKTNAGLETSLPGQEAYRGLRVHYAEAWKEKPRSKRIQRSIAGTLLYGLYKVRYYDTKRVWQITSLPPLLIRLFTKQQKVLLNILLCKGGKNPLCALSTQTQRFLNHCAKNLLEGEVDLINHILHVSLKDHKDLFGDCQYRKHYLQVQEWKLIYVVLSLMM